MGKEINETIIAAIGTTTKEHWEGAALKEPIGYQEIEEIWSEVLSLGDWWSMMALEALSQTARLFSWQGRIE